jgi:hypothetical protein
VEIVFGSGTESKVFAVRADGTSATGFPVGIQLQSDTDSSPALGDVTGDGYPDVVIGASNGSVFVFRGNNGGIPTGWPVLIRDNLGNRVAVRSSPVLADVDGNGSLDVVVGDQIGRVHALDASGQHLPGFPIQTGNLVQGSPAVWDVDGDGLTEVIAQSFDQKIYCWDTPWSFDPAKAVWPMFKRDQRNTGELTGQIFAVTAVPGDAPPSRAALFPSYPNPFFASTVIRYRVPDGQAYRGVNLHVFDVNGRLVRTLVDGEQPPGLHERVWDGRDDRGLPAAAGIYHYRLQVAGEELRQRLVLLR